MQRTILTGSPSKDHAKEFEKRKAIQSKIFLSQYVLQIFLYSGIFLFPWFVLVKTRLVDKIVIYAMASDLIYPTVPVLFIGIILSVVMSIIAYSNPEYLRQRLILTNTFFLIHSILVLSFLMIPEFAPGLGGRHESMMNLRLLSFLGYHINAGLGYILVVILMLTTISGFVFHLIWRP